MASNVVIALTLNGQIILEEVETDLMSAILIVLENHLDSPKIVRSSCIAISMMINLLGKRMYDIGQLLLMNVIFSFSFQRNPPFVLFTCRRVTSTMKFLELISLLRLIISIRINLKLSCKYVMSSKNCANMVSYLQIFFKDLNELRLERRK